jgi:DNA-binding transcriptional regulator YiaG
LVLRPRLDLEKVLTVTAVLALAKRGASLVRSKQAVEDALEHGRAIIELPTVEDRAALARDIEAAGMRVSALSNAEIDVRALRNELGLTQEQFALRYGFDVDAVRNWEQQRRKPEAATASYLRVIAKMPKEASEALEEPLA